MELTYEIVDGRKHFFQWDTGRKIRFTHCENFVEVQFLTPVGLIAHPIKERIVEVPDAALQHSGRLVLFLVNTEGGRYTDSKLQIDVASRPKPENYIHPEDEADIIEQITERLNENIKDAIASSEEKRVLLEQTNTTAGALHTSLSAVVKQAEAMETALEESIPQAESLQSDLNNAVTDAAAARTQLALQSAQAEKNLAALQSENFNSSELLHGVEDIKAYIGYTDMDVVGLQVDFENAVFTRLGGAAGLQPGADFDKFKMYGGRKRCNVADDGAITAWYGEETFKEDGSNGQVMVYQPKFYYRVVPLKLDPIDTGLGHHLRKVCYYISTVHKPGFQLHPAFYNENRNEVDYFLYSAYETCLYDASANSYNLTDAQTMDIHADKLSSISAAKPVSGLSQAFTRENAEKLAQNRGVGWHIDTIKSVSAQQLLMMIEMGALDSQSAIGHGVVSIPDNNTYNCSSLTGSTFSLGNTTGSAVETVNEIGGVQTTETVAGKVAITYRGVENPWGNIATFVHGINFYGNENMNGGQPYICSDFDFAESKNNENYVGAGFTIADATGYVSAMGFCNEHDWLFLPSETLGNSSLPVGDYTYVTPNLNGYRIATLGGSWTGYSRAGNFYWHVSNHFSVHGRSVGARLIHTPTKENHS